MRPAAIFALGMVGSFAAAAVLGAPAGAARGWGDAAAFGALADSVMNVGLSRNHVPGGVLVAVQDGEVFFARGYGFADLERRVPVNPERTVFRLASVSKLFTAALQLVEQGRIGLDADVNGYLERFQIRPAFGAPVTMFHLLTHTAGFDDRNVARKARFVLGFAFSMMQFSSRLVYDVSPELIALFTLPLVGAVAGLVLVWRCARLWMGGESAAGARIGYTLVAGAGIAFIVWLGQWNLLGYRF